MMALVYYETGIKVPSAESGGFDYVNVFVTQNESEARSAYRFDRRNYLARLTFDEEGCHTEFLNAAGHWEAAPSASGTERTSTGSASDAAEPE